MKLLRNNKYNELVNYNKGVENKYKQCINNLHYDVEWLEDRMNEIGYRLEEIANSINTTTSKDTIKKKIKNLVNYVRNGSK